MSRILALDVGEKRIGIAVSDPLNIIAQGIETIRQTTTEETLEKLKALVKEYDIIKVIVGMPFNMDGTKGKSANTIEGLLGLLRKELNNITVEAVDERLSTKEGERVLLSADISRKKRRDNIDKISAQLILQKYLDLKDSRRVM